MNEPPPTKVCGVCQQPKPLTDFHKAKQRSDGLSWACKPCACAKAKEKYRKVRRVKLGKMATTHKIFPYRAMLHGARLRAFQKNLPYDLDKYIPDIIARVNTGLCELTGYKMVVGDGKHQWNSPSIDRIQPELGYVYSNIRIICRALNVAFGNWGEEKLLKIIRRMKWYRKKLKLNPDSQKVEIPHIC